MEEKRKIISDSIDKEINTPITTLNNELKKIVKRSHPPVVRNHHEKNTKSGQVWIN